MPRPQIDNAKEIPAQLCDDLRLDPAIQPNAPLAEQWDDPTAVFLTGATGFLGAYLVQELMAAGGDRSPCPTTAGLSGLAG